MWMVPGSYLDVLSEFRCDDSGRVGNNILNGLFNNDFSDFFFVF